jgi:glycosyltransferase involved in cell wall biosynthesis
MPRAASALTIAHLTPTSFSASSVLGGGERYVTNVAHAVARAAAADGLAVQQRIVALGASRSTSIVEGITLETLTSDTRRPGPMNAISHRLRDALEGVDIVHVHQSLTIFGAYATATAASMGIPVVLTDLGGGADENMLAGRGMDLASAVVSISAYAGALIGSSIIGPHEVILGPVDSETFHPRAEDGARGEGLLCVGRILPHKGVDRIVRALPSGLSLTIVGQPYDQPYLEFVKKLARGKKVTFVHDADDERLRHYYSTSALLVQASTTLDAYGRRVEKPELLGFTPLEAMACGAPVLLARTASLPELIAGTDAGRLFRDDEELAVALQEWADGTWRPALTSEAVRQHVVQRFGLEAAGRRLLGVYQGVAR